MAAPPIPPLQHLADRTFSFFPPIVGIEHNEWIMRKATWSEILVSNCGGGYEIWIPRRYLGEVSRIEDPVLIVGLAPEGAGFEKKVLHLPSTRAQGVETPPLPAASDQPRVNRASRSSAARASSSLTWIG